MRVLLILLWSYLLFSTWAASLMIYLGIAIQKHRKGLDNTQITEYFYRFPRVMRMIIFTFSLRSGSLEEEHNYLHTVSNIMRIIYIGIAFLAISGVIYVISFDFFEHQNFIALLGTIVLIILTGFWIWKVLDIVRELGNEH